jgi:cytidylate kinase
MSLRIAIDGPSGAGKSTLARQLAAHLELPYIDTGAMYRAIGYVCMRHDLQAADDVAELLASLDMTIVSDPGQFRVLIAGVDISPQLRDTEVSMRASEVAQIPAVRGWLVARQRAAAGDGAVVEGRDIGSEVLPDADLKLFITADESVRMARRAEQLGSTDGAALAREIRERDRRDQERTVSPLVIPDGAIVIDTGAESVDDSFARILRAVREVQKAR